MNDWIKRQREAARVSEDDDLEPHLKAIEDWQQEARAVADKAPRHGTKKAVQECPPSDEAASSLHALYAIEADTIFHVCKQELKARVQSMHEDEPGLAFDDLLMEAYVLFQRSMVRYEGERSLEKHVRRPFRDRVRAFLDSHLQIPDDFGDREPVKNGGHVAPGFDIPSLYEEAIKEGKVPDEAANLYEHLSPKEE